MYGLSSDFQNRDVAIYARVSTEHEAQLSALENQIDWYKPILEGLFLPVLVSLILCILFQYYPQITTFQPQYSPMNRFL